MNAWDRQRGEPPRAFHAFAHYRDLGAARSIDKAYRVHREVCEQVAHPPRKRAHYRWELWASRFEWVARVDAYDAEQDRLAQEKHRKDLEDVRQRHANLAAGALAALTAPVQMVLKTLRDPEKLRALQAAAEKDPQAILALIRLISQSAHALPGLVNVERLALGLSTEAIEVEDKRDHTGELARQIRKDPAATKLAIELLGRVAGSGPATGEGPA